MSAETGGSDAGSGSGSEVDYDEKLRELYQDCWNNDKGDAIFDVWFKECHGDSDVAFEAFDKLDSEYQGWASP